MKSNVPDQTVGRLQQVAALPWRRRRDGELQILLVTSRTNGKWMLPKGWPIEGKSAADAAAQEALEEGGVSGTVSALPLGSYAYIKLSDDGSTQPAQAVVYALEVLDEMTTWREKGQRKRRWVGASKAAKLVFEPDLARFLLGVANGRILLTRYVNLNAPTKPLA